MIAHRMESADPPMDLSVNDADRRSTEALRAEGGAA
jgi:hypothetical protein